MRVGVGAACQVTGNQYASVRSKIVSLITMDVHNRDVVQELVRGKVSGPGDFKWHSQLRYYFVVRTLGLPPASPAPSLCRPPPPCLPTLTLT